MSQRLRVEIKARDEFWRKAVLIEWESRHPDWKLTSDASSFYLIDSEWFEALKDVATDCNSTIVIGPSDPGRRSMFRKLIPLSIAKHKRDDFKSQRESFHSCPLLLVLTSVSHGKPKWRSCSMANRQPNGVDFDETVFQQNAGKWKRDR